MWRNIDSILFLITAHWTFQYSHLQISFNLLFNLQKHSVLNVYFMLYFGNALTYLSQTRSWNFSVLCSVSILYVKFEVVFFEHVKDTNLACCFV